jgi:hypothetical protein
MKNIFLPVILIFILPCFQISAQSKKDKKSQSETPNYVPIYKDQGHGFMNTSGRIIKDGFDYSVWDYREGFFKVNIHLEGVKDSRGFPVSRYYMIDSTGNYLTAPNGKIIFPGIDCFSEGLAAWDSGYIDKTGRQVLDIIGKKTSFKNGFAAIEGGYRKWYIIDKKGTKRDSIISVYMISSIKNVGHNLFMINEDGIVFYDYQGNRRITKFEQGLKDITPFKNGVAYLYYSDNKFNIIDSTLRLILPQNCENTPNDILHGVARAGEQYYTLKGEAITKEKKEEIFSIPDKVKALAGPEIEITYKGEGIYLVSKFSYGYFKSGYLVNSQGKELPGIRMGRIEGQTGFIASIYGFKDGYAFFRTENSKALTIDDFNKAFPELNKPTISPEETRKAELAKQEAIREFLEGKICENCRGTGKMETATELKTKATKYNSALVTHTYTTKPCNKCGGRGRHK